MNKINRRECMGKLAGAGIAIGTMGQASWAGGIHSSPPTSPLGKTGIQISRLGIGTGMNGKDRQSDHTRLGFSRLVDLFQHCYDRGVTFFDLADFYGSHLYCREALRSIPREKVTLLTKLWWRYDGDAPGRFKYRSAKKAIQRFRHELAVDTIDIVLLHCLTKPDWTDEMQPYMDALTEARENGQIKAVGVSCHNFGAMKTAARSPWVDVMLARLNPAGVKMDASPEEVVNLLKEARGKGKGIIGMKIFGEGTLLHRKEDCIRYAQSNGVFDSMTIGATTPQQVDENLALMARYPVVNQG